ncbi:hypothetical protein N657DRAFT_657802 [Parathielavia appendiculata]|uniref:Uncharacterized protein n=1 Tax=Parathielavia appendiculata TaxID=2587402 RepID=A0AAN6Z0N6_9PEZI|nr:hypothetical protein N657DRAFT_657802 [Parathielavia appendiculata]
MVLPTCFLTIPALPTTVISSGYHVPATLAYAPTNTNYFGATSCGLNSLVKTTRPAPTVQCTLPPSISGKAYSVTPVVYVPRSASSDDWPWWPSKTDNYTCDPIPVASINKGNFQFACKGLRGKNMGTGFHSISWNLPTAAGISISPYNFIAVPPTSTPKYVVNTAKAKTSLVPTTSAAVTKTTTVTEVSTVTVRVTTRTTTCFETVTVTPPPISGRRLGRADNSANLEFGPRVRRAGGAGLLQPGSGPKLAASNSVIIDDVGAGRDSARDDHHGTDSSTDMVMDLKERAATSAAPTIGKPDFTYPPYGVTTIYVKSISTSFWTVTKYSTSFRASPVLTTTISVASWVYSTVTVTATPVPQSTP